MLPKPFHTVMKRCALHYQLEDIITALPRKLFVFVTHHHHDHVDGKHFLQHCLRLRLLCSVIFLVISVFSNSSGFVLGVGVFAYAFTSHNCKYSSSAI